MNRLPPAAPAPPDTVLHPAVLEGHLGHTFADPALLLTALTHRSYVNENPGVTAHNERLEFLGDAVLGLAAANLLMETCPERSEGQLSALRARIVSEQALADLAERVELGGCLRLGRGEILTGGRKKPSVLADALEAVIGALFLERGFPYTQEILRRLLAARVAEVTARTEQDYKSMLQEWTQAHLRLLPRYELLSQAGPDHERTFEVAVWLGERQLATGQGRSKRDAGQHAAAAALALLTAPGPDRGDGPG